MVTQVSSISRVEDVKWKLENRKHTFKTKTLSTTVTIECDRQADRRTDRRTDGIAMAIAAYNDAR